MTNMFLHILALVALTSSNTADVAKLELAVRTHHDDLAPALENGPMQRWILPQRPELDLEIGPQAEGDMVVDTCLLPAPAEIVRRLRGLPVTLRDDSFELGAESYRHPDLAFAVRLPASRRWVACGFEASKTAEVAQQVLVQESVGGLWRGAEKFDYLVLEHRHAQRSGQWHQGAVDSDGSRTQGARIQPHSERNDLRERERTYASMSTIERRHVALKIPAAAGQDPRAPALANRLNDMVAPLLARLGGESSISEPRLEILVENDHIEQGRHTGQIDPAVLYRGRAHLVYHSDDEDFYRVQLARLLIRRRGLELSPMLEDGAAVWLAKRWYGRTFDRWMPDLIFADVLPTAEELSLDQRPGDGSRVIFAPVLAWAFDQIPGETLLAKLASDPRTALAAALDKAKNSKPPRGLDKTPMRPRELPFQRGVSFAMANGLEIGYHAPGVDEQLRRLEAMGSDAVSLMPFAYQPRPDAPELSFLNRSPSSETDVGAIHAARRAHANDFFVLWKPHIWVSHESWPGDIAMDSDAEWDAFFSSYRRYIVHHAMLAQFAAADLFSIGVELGRTVDRESSWRHLIASVRSIYDGPLTYSGNWWADYDLVPFWDALDVIGVDAYFPLAGDANASDEELRAGAKKIAERLAEDAERHRRPVLLTEIGYAARRGAWISPHEEGGEISERDQERSWAALLDALGRPSWLRGLYAWKVFSHPRAEKATRPDFRFFERPARDALERYFEAPNPDSK